VDSSNFGPDWPEVERRDLLSPLGLIEKSGPFLLSKKDKEEKAKWQKMSQTGREM